jgi:hypothetical protein
MCGSKSEFIKMMCPKIQGRHEDMRLSLHVVTNIVRLNVRVDKLVDKNVDTFMIRKGHHET